jgi:ankyrin repeat protein
LVKAGADLSIKDNDGKTPLHYLASMGMRPPPLFFMRGIDGIFAAAKEDFNVRDNEGDTPLHLAARKQTLDVFDWLVKQGANPDATNNAGETPRTLRAHSPGNGTPNPETDLFVAISADKLESATRLLAEDQKLAVLVNQFGQSPLRAAATLHLTNMIELLEQNGAPWDEISAVLAERVDVLRRLLQERPAIATNYYGSTNLRDDGTLLHYAVDEGNVEIVKTLLDANAKTETRDIRGLSPLGRALLSKKTEIANLLLQRGAKKSLLDAVYTRDVDTVSAYLAQDKSALAENNGRAPLPVQIAAAIGDTNMLKLLFDKGASAEATNLAGMTPLHIAAICNQAGSAELLLRHGAKIEAVDRTRLTPLHWAAWEGSSDVLTLLLQKQCDPNTAVVLPRNEWPAGAALRPNLASDTPLHLAAAAGQTNVVEILLKAGARVNQTNWAGQTALDLTNPMDLQWRQYVAGFPFLLLPPQPGSPSAGNYNQVVIERRKAAADMLEAAGGKRLAPNRGFPGRPGS